MVDSSVVDLNTPASFNPNLIVNRPAGWMIDKPTLTNLINAGLSTTLLQTAFNSANTFQISASGTNRITSSTYTEHYYSYAQFSADITNSAVTAGVSYIIYDQESNTGETPAQESAAPATYYSEFATLAHAHGYKFIAAPASDIFTGAGDQWTNYLNSGLIAEMAAYSEVISLQMQRAGTLFGQYTNEGYTQAVTANPSVVVLSGLSTTWNNSYDPYWYDLMNQMNSVTPNTVSGYWINISSDTNVNAMVLLLEKLYTGEI